ncbi:MAG TPA: serine protease, partial [Micromonosporaceae bacterium]|nr:serine protease [Micromonosporaceae bacterium]
VHTYRAGTGLAELTGGWAMSVAGDTAVVALHSQRALGLLGGLGATVDRVARGFTARERTARSPGSFGGRREESVCGSDEAVDAVCYRSSDPTAYHRSKAVARLLINGVELCTAWRVGPHNRMLTNHHCFTDTESARNTEVWFDYMCASCGGYDVFRSTKVWGDQVLATDDRLDFTLFTVANFATVQKFGYLEFDLRRPAAGEELYVPQNPGGDPTVIAMGAGHGQCAVDNPSYDGYDVATDISYYCDTAGGSSGSPVLSMSTDKVLALHHFGGCPNSGVRIDLINHEIASLL